MAFVRFVLNFVVAGALLGIIAVSFFGPGILVWDNTTAMGKSLCDCADTTRQTAEKLIHYQLLGGGVGAGLGTIAGVIVGIRRRKKAAVVAAETKPV